MKGFPEIIIEKQQDKNVNYKNENSLNKEENQNELSSFALLKEGNYCLFKYIYLISSRFIIKYKNLYEEILEILSKEQNNKFDLIEIKKNAETYKTNKL